MEAINVVVSVPRPSAAVVELKGEHDPTSSRPLHELITGLIQTNDLVVIDVSHTLYIDAAVIGVLFEANKMARRERKRLRLQVGTTHIVRRALEITGVLDALETVATRGEALS